MSKPVLHTFGGSVWSAAPELAVIELESNVDKNVVNLVDGENFHPDFIKINPNATLPTLQADGKVYTNTTDVVSYLVKTASVHVKTGSSLISLVHEDKYDPNFALLLARNEEEIGAKANSLPGLFLSNRQKALEKFAATPGAAEFKPFYDAKIAGNGGLLAIYQSEAPAHVRDGFFQSSQQHMDNIRTFIQDILPGYLPESGFIGGERPGEDDFHVAAWLARVAATMGGSADKDGVKALEKEINGPVPAKIAQYWTVWSERGSWKTVYAGGLH